MAQPLATPAQSKLESSPVTLSESQLRKMNIPKMDVIIKIFIAEIKFVEM